nr:IS66 family transposase zinc-finger binding domain-containing protein [Leptospira weilii]
MLHDIPESEKICSCGQELTRIEEEKSEKLDIIPAKIQVEVHIRPFVVGRKNWLFSGCPQGGYCKRGFFIL